MNSRTLLLNAAAAALYAALTVALAPISYGPLQVRLSECMTLLAFYHPRWIPGLVVGCLLANLDSPFGMTDIIVGTVATFIAVFAMRFCKSVFWASLCPAVANGLIIGAELLYLAEIPATPESFAMTAFYIGVGEILAVTVIGIPLFRFLMKNPVLAGYFRNL